tara:strand:+ start:548 stop:808 length:261 start_codon:yes stop_codon:yes gene_type:complete
MVVALGVREKSTSMMYLAILVKIQINDIWESQWLMTHDDTCQCREKPIGSCPRCKRLIVEGTIGVGMHGEGAMTVLMMLPVDFLKA